MILCSSMPHYVPVTLKMILWTLFVAQQVFESCRRKKFFHLNLSPLLDFRWKVFVVVVVYFIFCRETIRIPPTMGWRKTKKHLINSLRTLERPTPIPFIHSPFWTNVAFMLPSCFLTLFVKQRKINTVKLIFIFQML